MENTKDVFAIIVEQPFTLKEKNKMFLDPKTAYPIFALSLCAFVFVITATIVTSANLPIGSDTYFHLNVARLYGQGNFSGAFAYIQSINQMPFYPPVYHFLIAPIALSSDPYTGLRILEMIFLPVTFALTAWVVWKFHGPKAAFISGLVLMGGWAFLDGAIQARPESIDLLLYPLILWGLLSVQKKYTAFFSALTVYNHGLAALTNIFGFAIKKLRENTWRKTIILVVISIIPIIALSLYFFGGAMKQWATYTPTENPQEALFWTYPPWIFFYAGISLLGWIFFFKKPQSEIESLLRWGLVGNLVMLPFWADRWLQYSSIPLAMLVGINISRWHDKKLYIVLAAIFIGAWIYMSNFLLIAIFHGYWQPERFVPAG